MTLRSLIGMLIHACGALWGAHGLGNKLTPFRSHYNKMSKPVDTKISSGIASALLNYADAFSFVVRDGKDVSKEAIGYWKV